MEITISSLEEMCALMCDNVIPKKEEGENDGEEKEEKEIIDIRSIP